VICEGSSKRCLAKAMASHTSTLAKATGLHLLPSRKGDGISHNFPSRKGDGISHDLPSRKGDGISPRISPLVKETESRAYTLAKTMNLKFAEQIP